MLEYASNCKVGICFKTFLYASWEVAFGLTTGPQCVLSESRRVSLELRVVSSPIRVCARAWVLLLLHRWVLQRRSARRSPLFDRSRRPVLAHSVKFGSNFRYCGFPEVLLRSSRSGPPRGDRGLDKSAEASHPGPIATWSAWEASNGVLRVFVPIMDTPKARGLLKEIELAALRRIAIL